MVNFRHEDYSQIKGYLPCVVNYDIIRTII